MKKVHRINREMWNIGLIALLLFIVSNTIDAYDFCVDGIYYSFSQSGVKVTNENGTIYSSYSGDVVIPEIVSYDGLDYTVTEISSYAFSRCSKVTSVTIPNSVTNIYAYAFQNCTGLTEVTIPNSVIGIGNDAFNGSGLKRVNFDAVACTSMPSSTHPMFGSCNSLTEVNIGENVTIIPELLFSGASNITEVSYNAIACTSAGSSSNPVFSKNANLTTINIGENVSIIPNYLFYNCTGITQLNFNAKACNSVGSSSLPGFNGCPNISEIIIGDNVTIIPDYMCYGLTALTEVTIPDSVTKIGTDAFYGCIGLTGMLSIPENVIEIDNDAFYNCTGVTKVNFNARACTSVGSSSSPGFNGCPNISEVSIGDNVTIIPDYMCYGLIDLTEIIIPNSVIKIGTNAFQGCIGLKNLTIPENVIEIGSKAFGGCIGVTEVNFSATTCTSVGSSANNRAFYDCDNISKVSIGNMVTIIPDYMCYGLKDLKEIVIPESVTRIGIRAFYQCTGLVGELIIPNSVTMIDASAFNGCSGLIGTLAIPHSVKSVGDSAFDGCSSLTELIIGNGIIEINTLAFDYCTGLTKVTIGESVASIDYYAFGYCTELSNIFSLNPEPPICVSSSVFSDVDTNTCILYVPTGSYNTYANAYVWKDFINIVEMDMTGIETPTPNEVEIVGYYAIDGKQINASQKGVNIVRYSDGSVKKMLVK